MKHKFFGLAVTLLALYVIPVTSWAIPITFNFSTTVTADGTPGVIDGDTLSLTLVADNGGTDLISQSWFQADILSAAATVGSYVAQFNFPFFNNDPVLGTDAAGTLNQLGWFDVDENNTDNLGAGSPKFAVNLLLTSLNTGLQFTGGQPTNVGNWTASVGTAVPEPGALALFGLGFAALVLQRKRR